jgi:hypothetical protein
MQAISDDKEPQEKGEEGLETIEIPASLRTPEEQLEDSDSWNISDRKLVRKIDFHLLPWICLLYIFALIDRYNTFFSQMLRKGSISALRISLVCKLSSI